MFELFGRDHLITLLVLLSLGAAIAWAGRRPGFRTRVWLGPSLAASVIGYAVTRYIQLGIDDALGWEYSLPLELCHWVMMACVVALLHPNRLASEIAYFWGLGGTLQAVLTPEVFEGFPSWEYIQFFWGHGAVLLAIVYIMTVRKFRPGAGCVFRMMVAVNVYAGIAGALNALFGWNYGYLCRPPLRPSLLDYLGPWPWYILSLEGLALLLFWLLYQPFKSGAGAAGAKRNGAAPAVRDRFLDP